MNAARTLLALLAASASAASLADSPVGNLNGMTVYRAQVPRLQQDLANWKSQETMEWCWAACLSNCFAHQGHPVSQARIVTMVYGSPDPTKPANSGLTISQVLNASLVDDFGRPFRSTLTGAYDFRAVGTPVGSSTALTNDALFREIQANRPFIVANTHHAMVAVSLDYVMTPQGRQVVGVGVLDPAPGGPSYHLLPTVETVPFDRGGQLTYYATFTVGGP